VKVRAARAFAWTWMDLLWLVFLGGLAALPPVTEIHKQLILIAFALFQLFERRLLQAAPRRGPALAVAVKIALATLLLAHTGQVAINSTYYPIFYIPVVTAAMLFGPWGTIGWTATASGAYLSYLWPALHFYILDESGVEELLLRVFFFFLLAMIINRFVIETRRQRDLYRQAAESLADANQKLRQAQADARRAERLAALGQLSAGLAHEIRNPLAVIKGSAEMLERQTAGIGGVAAELSGFISSEVNRVNLLVTRFLDFARPLRLEPQSARLEPLLDQAIQEARDRWPATSIAVERDYAPALPPIDLDPVLCQRAFANLAMNAFEAMDAGNGGAGTLAVSARPGAEGERSGVRVEFRDTGPGVAAEMREQIFNPFVTTKSAGVGLGLAIAAKIVDQHGGTLRLLPADAPGAAFEIFLPQPEQRDGGVSKSRQLGDAPSASRRPLPGSEARPQPDQRRGPQGARALGWQREGGVSKRRPSHRPSRPA
jgi:two-component system sensor histidine kinase HydH